MAQDMSPSNPLCLVFDMMCIGIGNWERFAKALRIDYVIRDLKENEKYNEVHEKIYKCIDEKRETSVDGDPDWFYWRNILLDVDEEELIEDIEEKYPYLLKDERIDISGVVHKSFDEFGIISHGASKKELFVKLQTKLKDRIKVCVGAGKEKWFQIKNMHTIQDNYFEKYSCVEKIRMYDFSNSGTHKECKILRTMYQWLQKHNDGGFCIKGYDAKQHLKFISEDYFNENPKDSDILVYSKLHNFIFYIDTNPDDIKKSIRHNRSNIRFLCSSNPMLYDASFVFIPLSLYDPMKDEIDNKVICKTCIDLKLLESSEIFKDLDLFEKWWKTFSNEVNDVKSELDERADISNDFFRNIMTYMALDYFALPSFTKNPENQIKEVQKLILLTPEQQNIIYSTHRYKVIKGSFGSGKTVVAQKILEHISNTSNSSELVCYIMHDSDSSFVKEMEKVATKLNKENVTVCKRSDLVKDTQALSSILEYLLAANKGKIIHVFIEEFNAENLNTNEIEKVKILLKREEFKDSHIVLVAQSMESERTETNDKLETKLYETYKYKELVEETEFEVFHLSFLMRSSQHINDMVNIAIPILEKAKMKSIIPKFDSELVSDLVVPATSINKNLNDNSKTDNNNQVNSDIAYSDMSKAQKGSGDEMFKQVNEVINKENTTSYNISDDTCQFLKQCTILADEYLSKREIESSYTFVGDRETAHNIKGKKPVIYYPLQSENEEFVHQVYCVSEVLKVLLNNDKVQVIICLNLESLSIVKSALETNRTKWTDDPQLLSTKDIYVCLTDYTTVRGCEFMNVILIYPTNEQHLKYNLVDCISRCVFSLRVIVLNLEITDKTLLEILDEWTKQNLVIVSNEDYLKNVNYEELKFFEEFNHDILNSRYKMQNMDIKNPQVIQKLQSFNRSQSDIWNHHSKAMHLRQCFKEKKCGRYVKKLKEQTMLSYY